MTTEYLGDSMQYEDVECEYIRGLRYYRKHVVDMIGDVTIGDEEFDLVMAGEVYGFNAPSWTRIEFGIIGKDSRLQIFGLIPVQGLKIKLVNEIVNREVNEMFQSSKQWYIDQIHKIQNNLGVDVKWYFNRKKVGMSFMYNGAKIRYEPVNDTLGRKNLEITEGSKLVLSGANASMHGNTLLISDFVVTMMKIYDEIKDMQWFKANKDDIKRQYDGIKLVFDNDVEMYCSDNGVFSFDSEDDEYSVQVTEDQVDVSVIGIAGLTLRKFYSTDLLDIIAFAKEINDMFRSSLYVVRKVYTVKDGEYIRWWYK